MIYLHSIIVQILLEWPSIFGPEWGDAILSLSNCNCKEAKLTEITVPKFMTCLHQVTRLKIMISVSFPFQVFIIVVLYGCFLNQFLKCFAVSTIWKEQGFLSKSYHGNAETHALHRGRQQYCYVILRLGTHLSDKYFIYTVIYRKENNHTLWYNLYQT